MITCERNPGIPAPFSDCECNACLQALDVFAYTSEAHTTFLSQHDTSELSLNEIIQLVEKKRSKALSAVVDVREARKLLDKTMDSHDAEWTAADKMRWNDMREYVIELLSALEEDAKLPSGSMNWLLAMVDVVGDDLPHV